MKKEKTIFKIRKDNYQPNALTLSRQEWTLIQRKLFFMFINQIDHSMDYSATFAATFQVPIKLAAEHIDYKHIKKNLLALQSKTIQYFIEDEAGKEEFQSIVLFPEVSYNANKNGMIEVTVMQKALLFLTNLGKQYTRYNLEKILSLSSIYSQRLFEILAMKYQNGNGTKRFRISVSELQEILCCTNYANNFNDFKKRVLAPAQAEIYEKASLTFDYDVSRKDGKKAIELEFSIRSVVEIADEAIRTELQYFDAAKPATKYTVAREILERDYTFTIEQVNIILADSDKLRKFIEVDTAINTQKLKIRISKTRYMARTLGFGK